MYLDGAGQPIVVCNSLKSAFELLERRSGNYSDRPRFIMAHEILGGGILFTLMNHSDPRCRRMRRAAHEALTKRAVQDYQPIQTKEATILVSSLLRPSSDLNQDRHFKRLAASTIMSILYDYPTIMSEHDHVLEGIERCLHRIFHASTTGSYFVDIFPWMKHIPERSCPVLHFPYFCGCLQNNQTDLQNGSGKAYEHLKSTLKCSLTFSIALNMILYVFNSRVVSGAQLLITDIKG